MRAQRISFPDQEALCVFPGKSSDLLMAISELRLDGGYPVIVLIGGGIGEEEKEITLQAIQNISQLAQDNHALIICGGTDMGIMAEIGRLHWQNGYNFPLVGIAPEELVSWPGGNHSTKFLWWGKQRWPLEAHYSHFILVPGSQFGDESPWIFNAATILSGGHPSVTILINGGEVSRKDIELSLDGGRPVIVLNHTGRLADDMSGKIPQNKLITIVQGNVGQQIIDVVKAALA